MMMISAKALNHILEEIKQRLERITRGIPTNFHLDDSAIELINKLEARLEMSQEENKALVKREKQSKRRAKQRKRDKSDGNGDKKIDVVDEMSVGEEEGGRRDRGETSTSEKANNNNGNISETHLIGTLPGDDKETFNIDSNKQNVGAPSNVAEQKRRSVDTSPVLSFPSSLPVDISSTLSSLSLVSSRLPLSLAPLGAVNSRHKTSTDVENEPLTTPQKSSLRPPRPPPPLGPPPRTIRLRSDSAVD